MRTWVLLGILVAFISCQPGEEPAAEPESEPAPEAEAVPNAVDADPDINTVEFENDLVRVVRISAPAGHESNRHTHMGGIYVSLSDSEGRTTVEGGEPTESATEYGEIADVFELAGEPHVTENIGDTTAEGILVELKVDDGTPVDPPSHDAVEVDPEHHTVEFENDMVRVVRMTYPEGHATPPHNHYSGVNVLLSDVRAASGPEGEDAEPAENTAGTVAWADSGEPHVTRNLGDEMHLVRVELKVQ